MVVRKKIVFDLDNTLVENRIVELAHRMAGREVQIHKKYDLSDIDPIVKDIAEELFEKPEYMCMMPACDGAYRKICQLFDLGYELYILTARPKHLVPGTLFMVRCLFNFMFGNRVLFTGSNWGTVMEDKLRILAEIKPDYYVDDYGEVACAVQKNLGIKSIIIHNDSTHYNEELTNDFTEIVPRVADIKSF